MENGKLKMENGKPGKYASFAEAGKKGGFSKTAILSSQDKLTFSELFERVIAV